MSLRMVSLWIVGALLVAATLKADPPQGEPAEIANQVKDQPVTPKPVPVASADKRQVQFDVKVWDVDHAALRAITKTDMGVHEFYKANGLIKQPDWISAAIGDAVSELLSPPGRKGAAPAPLPTRAFAVLSNSVSKKLLGHDISSAFKTIAEPTLVATNGREATLLSGGEVPILVPQAGDSVEIAFLEFGLKLKILPRRMDKGRIALGLDFENSELDPKSENGESGIRLISSQGFRLSAQMKLGEQLLVAQQTVKQDVTRLVQIQPTVIGDQVVSEKPNGSPLAPADRNVVEQFAEQFDAPASSKPVDAAAVGDTNVTRPSAKPAQIKTHSGVIGEEHDVEKTVLFQVRVYEVDHSGWAKEQGVEKRRQALDEVLRPWIGHSRGSKLEKVNVKAWTVKELAPATEIEKLGNAVRLVSEPELAVVEGHTGSFDYGGRTPQLRLIEVTGHGTSEGNAQVRPLATTFALEPAVTDAGRVLLTVYFNPHGELRKKRSSGDELKKHGVKAAAELSVGQTLCLSDARPETSDNEDSLLVTITPYEIVSREAEKRIPPAATVPATPKELEITVEDRWPIADIKVGQRVVAIPVTIEKTSLQADTTALAFSFDAKYSQRVTRIEPLPNQAGRRVTISVPFNQHEEANDRLKTIVENYLDGIRSSSSTFVIPVSMINPTDLMSGRPAQELYAQIPVELRPRPVELTVGESFMAYGVAALMGSAKERAHHEIGALSFDYLDDDGGGIWRATATKIGTARLIQLAVGSDMVGPARLTEYFVKADTRELELHIRQQFPSARVTITSIGAAAVLLKGTVASDEDAHGIVELAEQFAPKVLNRLKVGAVQAADARTMRTPARPIELTAADDSEATGNPLKSDHAPQRITPAAAKAPKKSEELQQLRDEIHELRQDVRELIQRLDREQAATPQQNDDAKPANAETHRRLIPAQIPLHSAEWEASALQTGPPTEAVAIVNGEVISYRDLVRWESPLKELDGAVNLLLLKQAAKNGKLDIGSKEIDAEILRVAAKSKLPIDQWYAMLEHERGISRDRYREFVIWPGLALKRLAGDDPQQQLKFLAGLRAAAKIELVDPEAKLKPVSTETKQPAPVEKSSDFEVPSE